MTYGLGLNLGSYYGDGSMGGGYSGSGYNQVVSASNIRSMSRNTGAGYEQQMHIIEKYIKHGEIDKALDKYNSLFDEIKSTNTYGNKTITDSQVTTIMSNAYQNATGTEITDALDKKTSSPFASGLLQGIPIIGMFCQDTTSAEAYAKLDNDKVSAKDKAFEYAGAMSSAAATGAAIGTAVGGWAFGAGTVIGAAIGAGVGFVQTFLKDIF